MLKNKNKQLTGFGPIWSQFEQGQLLRHKFLVPTVIK